MLQTLLGVPTTRRQGEILAYIRRHIREHGAPPTIREIGEAVGINSPNGVTCHLKSLGRRGLLRKHGSALSRGWTPTDVDLPRCPCCNQPVPESVAQPTE